VNGRPRSILVPVDFGDASARAVSVAGALAAPARASLRLIHAGTFDAPPYLTREQTEAICGESPAIRRRAEAFLIEFGQKHAAHAFTVDVDDRSPVDAILAESATADFVVMGTHGRHGPSRWWVGSVAERVLREIAQPLLIVRAQAVTSPPEEVFRRVLVHASAPLVGATTTAYAEMLAECFGGRIFDARYEPVEPALDRTRATLLAVATPTPRGGDWLSNIGEPIVRYCEQPILFVPDSAAASPPA
jgi:nucleotide-binding universal stress UspA family protein